MMVLTHACTIIAALRGVWRRLLPGYPGHQLPSPFHFPWALEKANIQMGRKCYTARILLLSIIVIHVK